MHPTDICAKTPKLSLYVFISTLNLLDIFNLCYTICAETRNYKRRTGAQIELLPENPDYPIIQVNPEEPFAIEGLAVGLIRNSVHM